MIYGHFRNCYGLKSFNMLQIDFSKCNKAIIYAPNGAMKSSLTKVFEDISKGVASSDRIFKNNKSSYEITHYTSTYKFNGVNPKETPPSTEYIYVINSFANQFEFTKETVSTLLADEETRNKYNIIITELRNVISTLEEKLKTLTGLTKPKIKSSLASDFGLPPNTEWTDIIKTINDKIAERQKLPFLENVLYTEIFSPKALEVYQKQEFKSAIEAYIISLNSLLNKSNVLSEHFNEKNAEDLGKGLKKNNIFKANHAILLKDGRKINSIDEWNNLLSDELKELYKNPKLVDEFKKLKDLLTKNEDVLKVRDIIIANREIIPYLDNIEELKQQSWLDYFFRPEVNFEEYSSKISAFYDDIKELHKKANQQSQRWNNVVSEFNRRFRVPFKIKITNKANFLLKDEAPNLTFEYSRGLEGEVEYAEVGKDDLMPSLSVGERRALYLLYILFDLDKIRKKAVEGTGKFLIVVDDIADSFDYKNKYAIVEYLHDLAEISGIDMLVLTHNFDFYRTLKFRLDIIRNNCYIAQKNADDNIDMTVFKYQKDFFKNVIKENIKSGIIDTDEKKKLLVSSIPFYRNLSEYSGNDDDFLRLTCLLHIKTKPLDTTTVNLLQVWDIIKKYLGNKEFASNDATYLDVVFHIADDLVNSEPDDVLLENKLILSIAIRLKSEQFLKQRLIEKTGSCIDATSNQTRKWYSLAISFLSEDERIIMDDVHLITPENIHLNAFMYEPIIDISAWVLRKLYVDITNLIKD